MTLDLSRDAVDFIMPLDAKQFRQIMRKILMLLTDPRPQDAQLLKGYDALWRTDIGEFRIAYRIEGETVRILAVGRRNDDDIFRKLDRKAH